MTVRCVFAHIWRKVWRVKSGCGFDYVDTGSVCGCVGEGRLSFGGHPQPEFSGGRSVGRRGGFRQSSPTWTSVPWFGRARMGMRGSGRGCD